MQAPAFIDIWSGWTIMLRVTDIIVYDNKTNFFEELLLHLSFRYEVHTTIMCQLWSFYGWRVRFPDIYNITASYLKRVELSHVSWSETNVLWRTILAFVITLSSAYNSYFSYDFSIRGVWGSQIYKRHHILKRVV